MQPLAYLQAPYSLGEDNMERLHKENNQYNRALRHIRAWDKRVVTREIRKKVGELPQVADTIKAVDDKVGGKKRKSLFSEIINAKGEKREETKHRFTTPLKIRLLLFMRPLLI